MKMRDEPLVIKAAGLAKGKGVTICYRQAEALETIDAIMRGKRFGDAGKRIVIEELLTARSVRSWRLCESAPFI